ncbi:MAG TPA: 4Fe-4S dicluster domain-containing protein [Anaeromyxobacter sp.]|nr:4Fe-4S dicluster domain-containing protein [Anaeromyxobacter sp.]
MTKARIFGGWRGAAGRLQAALFLLLPFLEVNGESAFRLDVPAGRLHVFGASLAIEEAFPVLAAALCVTFAFLLGTLLVGRAWCGWSCPQTVLSDLTSWVGSPLAPRSSGQSGRAGRRRLKRPVGLAWAALVSALFAAAFLWYFVPPAEFAARLAAGRLGPVLSWSWAGLGTLLLLDLAFLRQLFCATVCPYARLQGVLLDRHSLVVAYDSGRAADCVDCGACVRVCPTGIDIRNGLQMQCIACAACIDACQPIMGRLGRAPDLVGYFLGEPGTGLRASRLGRLLRPGALALFAAVGLSAVLLGTVVARRSVLGVEVHGMPAFAPRRAEDGAAVNALALELENRSRAKVTVSLSLEAGEGDGTLQVRPDRIELAPGERRQLNLLVSARHRAPGRARARLVAEVRSASHLLGRELAEVPFVVPESR